MKKFLSVLALTLLPMLAMAGADDVVFTRRNSLDSGQGITIPPHPTTGIGLLQYDSAAPTASPTWVLVGAGLSISSGVLSATAASQVNADWNAMSGIAQILNRPTLATVATTGAYADLSGRPSMAAIATSGSASDLSTGTVPSDRLPALAISQTAGLQAALDGKFPTPAGTIAQYVRGNGTLSTLPAAYSFNIGYPTARTLAVSTSYQATDNSKAAFVTLSLACVNNSTVLAANPCTAQVRVSNATATCSSGTVVGTVSATVDLGLVITQRNTTVFPVNLPPGGFFIICPTAGTFTVPTAVDQSAG